MAENKKIEMTENSDFNPNNIITSGNSNNILDNISNENKSNISCPNFNTSLLNKIHSDSSGSLMNINNHSEIITPPESLLSFLVKTNSATSGDSTDILNDLNNYIFEDRINGESEDNIIYAKENIPNFQNNENNNINNIINLNDKQMKEDEKEEGLFDNNVKGRETSKNEQDIKKCQQELKNIRKRKEYYKMMEIKLGLKEAKIIQKMSLMQKQQIPKIESEKGVGNIGECEDEKKDQNPQKNIISDKCNKNNREALIEDYKISKGNEGDSLAKIGNGESMTEKISKKISPDEKKNPKENVGNIPLGNGKLEK